MIISIVQKSFITHVCKIYNVLSNLWLLSCHLLIFETFSTHEIYSNTPSPKPHSRFKFPTQNFFCVVLSFSSKLNFLKCKPSFINCNFVRIMGPLEILNRTWNWFLIQTLNRMWNLYNASSIRKPSGGNFP